MRSRFIRTPVQPTRRISVSAESIAAGACWNRAVSGNPRWNTAGKQASDGISGARIIDSYSCPNAERILPLRAKNTDTPARMFTDGGEDRAWEVPAVAVTRPRKQRRGVSRRTDALSELPCGGEADSRSCRRAREIPRAL